MCDNSVVITEKDFDDVDEFYGKWFVCPLCNNKEIIEFSNFCSNCGIKLDWKEYKEKEKEKDKKSLDIDNKKY